MIPHYQWVSSAAGNSKFGKLRTAIDSWATWRFALVHPISSNAGRLVTGRNAFSTVSLSHSREAKSGVNDAGTWDRAVGCCQQRASLQAEYGRPPRITAWWLLMGCLWGCVRRSAPAGATSLLVGDAWREQRQAARPGKHLGRSVTRCAAQVEAASAAAFSYCTYDPSIICRLPCFPSSFYSYLFCCTIITA